LWAFVVLLEVGEDREDAAVVVGAFGEVEFVEDVADVGPVQQIAEEAQRGFPVTAALCGAASLRDPLRSFSGVGERVGCV
jgi:hypothetical protein